MCCRAHSALCAGPVDSSSHEVEDLLTVSTLHLGICADTFPRSGGFMCYHHSTSSQILLDLARIECWTGQNAGRTWLL